jgi:hypothetical protein
MSHMSENRSNERMGQEVARCGMMSKMMLRVRFANNNYFVQVELSDIPTDRIQEPRKSQARTYQ